MRNVRNLGTLKAWRSGKSGSDWVTHFSSRTKEQCFYSSDKRQLVVAAIPRYAPGGHGPEALENELNLHALKSHCLEAHNIDLTDTSTSGAFDQFSQDGAGTTTTQPQDLIIVQDYQLPSDLYGLEGCPLILEQSILAGLPWVPKSFRRSSKPCQLVRIRSGDPCPRCEDGKLKVEKAVELGHTFHLGTRYSKPLGASVALPKELRGPDVDLGEEDKALMQMGCHGIGVSRMIGAVAAVLVDDKGLNWPAAIAPFQVVVLADKNFEDVGMQVHDELTQREAHGETIDVVLDDRGKGFSIGWKLNDADAIGYPVIVVAGRSWRLQKKLELQCRRLGVKEAVPLDRLGPRVQEILERL